MADEENYRIPKALFSMMKISDQISLGSTSPTVVADWTATAGPRIHHIVEAARYKALNRYNVYPGRIFGNPKGKERYRVIELYGNNVIYKDLTTYKVQYANVDELLKAWNAAHVVEITPLDDIIATIKKYLTPLLGGVLVGALITWLAEKVGK